MSLKLEGKKIVFIGPVFYDYHSIIQNKIENLGAEVTFFPEKKDGILFGILNTINSSLINIYQKWYFYFLFKKIKNKKFDYFFLIRGYKIPISFIKKLKEKNPSIKCIMYQWDSEKNNPYFDKVKYFNEVSTFDYADFKKNNEIKFLQLFYTKDILELRQKNTKIEYDFFCFSSFTMDRYNSMISFISFCKKNNYSLNYFCFIPFSTYFKLKYIKRIHLDKKYLSFKPMPRQDYLKLLNQSSIIVDYSHSTQTGLSMRIIETYGAGKKILTTNTSIINNPIYSTNWVQILDEKNILKNNFSTNQTKEEFDNLYIDNWIKTIFNIL